MPNSSKIVPHANPSKSARVINRIDAASLFPCNRFIAEYHRANKEATLLFAESRQSNFQIFNQKDEKARGIR
jgi:hypothetical protein